MHLRSADRDSLIDSIGFKRMRQSTSIGGYHRSQQKYRHYCTIIIVALSKSWPTAPILWQHRLQKPTPINEFTTLYDIVASDSAGGASYVPIGMRGRDSRQEATPV